MKLNLNWTLSVRQTETVSAPRHAGPALFVCCLLKLFLLLFLMLLLLGTSSLYSCAYLVRFYLLYTVFPVFSFLYLTLSFPHTYAMRCVLKCSSSVSHSAFYVHFLPLTALLLLTCPLYHYLSSHSFLISLRLLTSRAASDDMPQISFVSRRRDVIFGLQSKIKNISSSRKNGNQFTHPSIQQVIHLSVVCPGHLSDFVFISFVWFSQFGIKVFPFDSMNSCRLQVANQFNHLLIAPGAGAQDTE